MQSLLILTEARSGSTWLTSLIQSTGIMGMPDEWLDWRTLGQRPDTLQDYIDAVVARGSTPNGRFAVKIFPRHLHFARLKYGIDFIEECRRRFDVNLLRLDRNDRLRQTISFVRGRATGQWTSRSEAKVPVAYSFKDICETFFRIERSYAFWNAYLGMKSLPHETFIYENLIADPRPFVDAAARMLGVVFEGELRSSLGIQRDETTEAWVARFKEDIGRMDPLPFTSLPAARKFRNLQRFFRGQPLTPLL